MWKRHRESARGEPGESVCKTRLRMMFTERGGPHPHAQPVLAAFSAFAGIRVSTGSPASQFPAALPVAVRVISVSGSHRSAHGNYAS